MFWHTYKFVNSWNSSKWNEFEQRQFELPQKHKNALLQELSLSKVLKYLHGSHDTVCQNWQIFPKWSDKCKIHNMDYIRNIFQACFRTRSILAELHVLSFVSKSYPSSLIKSRHALLAMFGFNTKLCIQVRKQKKIQLSEEPLMKTTRKKKFWSRKGFSSVWYRIWDSSDAKK